MYNIYNIYIYIYPIYMNCKTFNFTTLQHSYFREFSEI